MTSNVPSTLSETRVCEQESGDLYTIPSKVLIFTPPQVAHKADFGVLLNIPSIACVIYNEYVPGFS